MRRPIEGLMSWLLRLSPWHDPEELAKGEAQTARAIANARRARQRAEALLASPSDHKFRDYGR